MARIVWSPEALSRLDDIHGYLVRFDPDGAVEPVTRLFAAAYSLSEFPSRGRPALNGTRELVSVPPYVVRYKHAGDNVRILSIRHSREFR